MAEPLHPDLVLTVRRYYLQGYGVTTLANHYGISRQAVSNVVHGHTHKRLVVPPQLAAQLLPPLEEPKRKQPKRLPVSEHEAADLVERLAARRRTFR